MLLAFKDNSAVAPIFYADSSNFLAEEKDGEINAKKLFLSWIFPENIYESISSLRDLELVNPHVSTTTRCLNKHAAIESNFNRAQTSRYSNRNSDKDDVTSSNIVVRIQTRKPTVPSCRSLANHLAKQRTNFCESYYAVSPNSILTFLPQSVLNLKRTAGLLLGTGS